MVNKPVATLIKKLQDLAPRKMMNMWIKQFDFLFEGFLHNFLHTMFPMYAVMFR
jgi:hypothetical protein